MSSEQLKKACKAYQLTGVHPAADIFPMITGAEYESLVNDVREHGFSTKGIIDQNGMLVDGRNRICASLDAEVDLEFITENFACEKDVVDYIVSLNIKRRHMTQSQRNMLAVELLPFYESAAKERKVESGKKTGRGKECADLHTSNGKHRAASDAAAAVGGSERGVGQAKRVAEGDHDLAEKVKAGEISLDAAEKLVKQKEREHKAKDPQPETTSEKVDVISLDGTVTQIDAPRSVKFNRTNDSVDWASWTWNPVTGCLHGCEFCYAREIALSQRMQKYYPLGFEPAFHEYRLDAPKNTKPSNESPQDGRVFVCSMADLFGKWVPKKWISQVFTACQESPEWEYLFLTKWPAKYLQMPLLERAWYGASVVKQSDVSRVEQAMAKIESPNIVKWISLEPMLQPIKFDDLSWCNLVVIGSQTATTQPDGPVPAFAPEFDWVVDVVNQCREFCVPYYLKANLGPEHPGMKLPKMEPAS